MSRYIYSYYLILDSLDPPTKMIKKKKKKVFWHLSHPKVVFMWICPSTVWSPQTKKKKRTNQCLKWLPLHPNKTVGENPTVFSNNLPNNQLLHAMKLFAGYGCSVSTTWPSLMPCSFGQRRGLSYRPGEYNSMTTNLGGSNTIINGWFWFPDRS